MVALQIQDRIQDINKLFHYARLYSYYYLDRFVRLELEFPINIIYLHKKIIQTQNR